jgi:gamma-tubulin complex component 3
LVETAIRGSNAQYRKPEYLQCLDVKMLQAATGDDGWQIFSLEYKVGPPLNTILTPKIMNDYLRIFNFLWRVKRIDYILSTTWTQQMGNKRALAALEEIQVR